MEAVVLNWALVAAIQLLSKGTLMSDSGWRRVVDFLAFILRSNKNSVTS